VGKATLSRGQVHSSPRCQTRTVPVEQDKDFLAKDSRSLADHGKPAAIGQDLPALPWFTHLASGVVEFLRTDRHTCNAASKGRF